MHPNFFSEISVTRRDVGKQFLKTSTGFLKCKTFVGIRLIKNAALRTASPHKYLGVLVEKSKALAISRRCRFFLSTTPFFCGVSLQEL